MLYTHFEILEPRNAWEAFNMEKMAIYSQDE